MDRAGSWFDAPAIPGSVVVNLGELLQFATAGVLFAAPHRVINPSLERHRISVPVFINPPLAHEVRRIAMAEPTLPWSGGEHVHRVLPRTVITDRQVQALPFGPAEWRRKGENLWCSECCAV